MENKKTIHFQSFDALRFLSFTAIFIHHCRNYIENDTNFLFSEFALILEMGNIGVNFFFVLSGFLISYLLFAEKEQTQTISLSKFYFRRILRIFPLFYAVVLFCFFVYPFLTGKFDWVYVKEHLLSFLFFFNNFDLLHTGFYGIMNDFLAILWSIAVEEQFYLIWPLVFAILPLRGIFSLSILIVIASVAFRAFNVSELEVLYFHTFSVMSDFAMGALAAYVLINYPSRINFIKEMSRHSIIVVYIIGITLTSYLRISKETLPLIWKEFVISCFFVFVILEQEYAQNSFFKVQKIGFFTRMGKYTYSLYCTHVIIMAIIYKIFTLMFSNGLSEKLDFYIVSIVSFCMCILICSFIYKYFEKPILDLKDRYKVVK